VTLRYRTGPSKTETAAVTFADAAKRDEFLAALTEALGPGWQRRQKNGSRWGPAFWVLLATVVAALVTWGLHAEATRVAEGKEPFNWGKVGKVRLLKVAARWVEDSLGPTGVLAVGGIVVGLGVLLLIAALASPPLRVVVEPAPD
jgi:hypothetical protein